MKYKKNKPTIANIINKILEKFDIILTKNFKLITQ
jgi:hypothetical protein